MIVRRFVTIIASLWLSSATLADQYQIDLSGEWQAQLDSNSAWQSIRFPGALRDSNLGEPVGPETEWIGTTRASFLNDSAYSPYRVHNDGFRIPFWLQPHRRYLGEAIFKRVVSIPDTWKDRRTVLKLERPHWQTRVAVDGRIVGSQNSLSTPHQYELSDYLTPGEHTLTIYVDNRTRELDVGRNSHSISDHTQSAWNGIVGELLLVNTDAVSIDRVQVHPSDDAGSVLVRMHLSNLEREPALASFRVEVRHDNESLGYTTDTVEIDPGRSSREVRVELSRTAAKWDEFEANLHQVSVSLTRIRMDAQKNVAVKSDPAIAAASFGFRTVATQGNRWTINGRPLFLRGTLECCVFPMTGYPPTDVNSWESLIQNCKSHGLNHIRFHSWCPPEAAFVAADRLGFYFQVECASWPNDGVALGTGAPIDGWLYEEGTRILDQYGNHPSFVFFAAGNEAGGPDQGRGYLHQWVKYFDDLDDRVLITSTSGWPAIEENQFHVTQQLRMQHWEDGVSSRINRRRPETMSDHREIVSTSDKPLVSHETGQWCAYPDIDERSQYTGPLQANNLEIFRDFLERAGLLHQANDFHLASGALQSLVYKEEIERCLRTPALGGFQLLGLSDFPGQGTAPVGMLNAFWKPKKYFSSEKFRQCCGPVVILARLPRRTYEAGEWLTVTMELSNFGADPLVRSQLAWQIIDASANTNIEHEIATGLLKQLSHEARGLISYEDIRMALPEVTDAKKLILRVRLLTTDGVPHKVAAVNEWDLWVYPREKSPEDARLATVHVADELNDETIEKLAAGCRVLLLADPKSVDTNVVLGFSPIFWNSAWTIDQPPHTLGILCNPRHLALDRFPTEGHTNWQWWELIRGAAPMNLDRLANPVDPIVQVVPDWFKPQRLGLVFETQVGRGKLLACSIDLENDLASRPVARQLRHSLMEFAASDKFCPPHQSSVDELKQLFYGHSFVASIGATAKASESHVAYPASAVIDADPSTFWHTSFSPVVERYPHWIEIDLQEPISICGVRCRPRQDMSNGRIGAYRIDVSDNGHSWKVAAIGQWGDHPARNDVYFESEHKVRFVRLTGLNSIGGERFASLAEVDVIPTDNAIDVKRTVAPETFLEAK